MEIPMPKAFKIQILRYITITARIQQIVITLILLVVLEPNNTTLLPRCNSTWQPPKPKMVNKITTHKVFWPAHKIHI